MLHRDVDKLLALGGRIQRLGDLFTSLDEIIKTYSRHEEDLSTEEATLLLYAIETKKAVTRNLVKLREGAHAVKKWKTNVSH